jgi:small multidrug resistance family-3 protein
MGSAQVLHQSAAMELVSHVRALASSWFTIRRAVDVAVMLVAATFEVGGDAMIRAGLRGHGWAVCGLGVATLGGYGLIVNLLSLDFSRLLATYVGFFAIVSVAFGRVLFAETVPPSTWVGLAIILFGSAVLQMGAGAN